MELERLYRRVSESFLATKSPKCGFGVVFYCQGWRNVGVVLESGVQAGRNLPPSPQKEVNMTQQISIKENDELKNILDCKEGTIRNYLWNTMNKDKLIELIIFLVKTIRELKQVLYV